MEKQEFLDIAKRIDRNEHTRTEVLNILNKDWENMDMVVKKIAKITNNAELTIQTILTMSKKIWTTKEVLEMGEKRLRLKKLHRREMFQRVKESLKSLSSEENANKTWSTKEAIEYIYSSRSYASPEGFLQVKGLFEVLHPERDEKEIVSYMIENDTLWIDGPLPHSDNYDEVEEAVKASLATLPERSTDVYYDPSI